MANGPLLRQSRADGTQPISGLIGLPGGLSWLPFTSGLFVLVLATSALETEHVEECYIQSPYSASSNSNVGSTSGEGMGKLF